MEKCYEYLGCDKCDCSMYGRVDNVKCWEVKETLCHNKGMAMLHYPEDVVIFGDRKAASGWLGVDHILE
jgi:hypothetical protein